MSSIPSIIYSILKEIDMWNSLLARARPGSSLARGVYHSTGILRPVTPLLSLLRKQKAQ